MTMAFWVGLSGDREADMAMENAARRVSYGGLVGNFLYVVQVKAASWCRDSVTSVNQCTFQPFDKHRQIVGGQRNSL
jgi:hypothetical protein